ncbi:hypothetical protein ACVXG7_09325 [Enterobacter hormaechei]
MKPLNQLSDAVVTKAKINIALGDETKQAVIDAVRESDLFASLQLQQLMRKQLQ